MPKHIIAYIYHYVRDFSKSQNVPNLTQASLKERRKIDNVEKKYRDEGFRIFPFPVPSRVRENDVVYTLCVMPGYTVMLNTLGA